MKILKDNQPTYFDVDETLIFWDEAKLSHQFEIGDQVYGVHWKHVRQIKMHKNAGHTIFVWSAGGAEWATKVIKALGLENYVDYVMPKPKFYYDDKDCADFMPRRSYIKRNEGNRN